MNNLQLKEYEPIVLKSIIDAGYPMGKFTWLKDGQPLPASNRYRTNYDINTRTASLFIDAARPATDTGPYTVHVENPVGKDETTGVVNVEPTPAIDDRPFVPPSKFGKLEPPTRKAGMGPRGPILQPDETGRDRENMPPWIRLVKGLEDQVIDESKAAHLVCMVDAHPAATVNTHNCLVIFRTTTKTNLMFRSTGSKMIIPSLYRNASCLSTTAKLVLFVCRSILSMQLTQDLTQWLLVI